MRLDKTPVDLHALAAEAVSELSTAHPGKTIRHIALGDGSCCADGDRLIQAMGNLVSNALAYGERGSAVTVTSVGAADSLRFEVHNEGPPIDAAVVPTLFEPMTRGSERGQPRSIGLGLYIVREIAHAHGGSVACTSAIGDGTTFTVSLPLG